MLDQTNPCATYVKVGSLNLLFWIYKKLYVAFPFDKQHRFDQFQKVLEKVTSTKNSLNPIYSVVLKFMCPTFMTMLADSKLPYYFFGLKQLIPVAMCKNRCHVTILNSIDHLGKFDGKDDEGFIIGYSINSKAFRVFNSRTRIVEENMHVQFSENTPNIAGNRPNWFFDIDALTKSMNYKPVVVENQSNGNAGTKACDDAEDNEKKVTEEPGKEGGDPSNKNDDVNNTNNINTASDGNNTNNVNTVSSTINTTGIEVNAVSSNTSIELSNDPNMPELEDIVYSDDYEDVGAEADMNNLNTFMPISHIPTTRIHKDHPVEQIIGDLNSTPQTRRMTKNLEEHEPKKVIHALKDPSWIEAMQDDLLQFKLQKVWTLVWTLVDLPNGKRAIGTKWVYMNMIDERGIVIKNKARLIAPEFEKTMHWKFQMSSLGELTFFLGLQVKQKEDGIFISQDKYATEILKKFGFTDVKTASTPMDTQKPLLKDEDVCACARYQVNPKVSHLHAMKRFFRYLKGQPKLGIWYPKDSPFDLVAYTDSGYIGASLDRKSTTGGCQFLRCRLILWQCKKQNVDANSITEVEYVAASSCCGQISISDCQYWNAQSLKSRLRKWQVNTARHKLTVVRKVNAARHNLLLLVAKTVNGKVQLQALIDGKKIITTEAWTPPLLPIPLPAPSTSRRADIPEADTPPRKRLLTYYLPDLVGLEARVTVLETDARHHEWQRQAADDLAVQYIMRTQALEARARVDTWRQLKWHQKEPQGQHRPQQQHQPQQQPQPLRHKCPTPTIVIKCQCCSGPHGPQPRNGTDSHSSGTVSGSERVLESALPGQHTGRAFIAGSGDKKPYGGSRPLCSKCNYHHDGPCAPKCYKCNKYGHIARNYRDTGNANHINNQKGTGSGQKPTCFECGVQGHFQKECPRLKNNKGNRGNQAGNDRAPAKVYVVGNAGANPDNVVAGTFLLNNRYAYILFDTGADRSFVSTAFSSQIDITPSTLDHYYDVELADGRIIGKEFKWIRKIESIKDWTSPKVINRDRQFLVLRCNYRRKRRLHRILRRLKERFGRCVDAKREVYGVHRSQEFATHFRSKRVEPPLRVRALVMTISLDLPKQILKAQTEARKPENIRSEDVGGMLIERNGWLPNVPYSQSLQNANRTNVGYEYLRTIHIRNGQSERTIQTLQDMLRSCAIDFWKGLLNHLPLVEFSYNNSNSTSSIKAAPFEALLWSEVPFTTVFGDKVILKLRLGKGIVRFGKRGKYKPSMFDLLCIERVGEVPYKLELPEELSRVHNTFHVSNLKKCHADEPLAVPLDGLHLDDKLHFVEEPVEIVGREVKRLKREVRSHWSKFDGTPREVPSSHVEREVPIQNKKSTHHFTKTLHHRQVLHCKPLRTEAAFNGGSLITHPCFQSQ
ncbi:uncharacterized mitochondrial protein-like protein [Tanacetum coccineum]|uniref:Uncharacterized mitochondrial protein-like protein n=1 Tax=Tanacetum coccineum TaxID=301880 RepID=A0ABQ5F9K2_9ASTR